VEHNGSADRIPSQTSNALGIISYAKGETMKRQVVILTLFAFVIATACSAQMGGDKSKRPSPPASASCNLGGGKTITTDYSSPRMRGRVIYGDLVPYNKVWRTGANEATTFVTTADLIVGGAKVPAGSYTIFTIPNFDKWTLIINKKTGEWGIPYKYESDELARVDMKVTKLPASVENFTIAYDTSASGCTLRIDWETTRASVEISAK
jgi:hypothetical protein